MSGAENTSVRLDRWLWAARFFKTRAQAKTAIEAGKVHYRTGNQQARPKASKEVHIGDTLVIRRGEVSETVVIIGLAQKRGNATAAAELYDETLDSVESRETERARRRMERLGLRVPATKPSKQDRRALRKLKQDS